MPIIKPTSWHHSLDQLATYQLPDRRRLWIVLSILLYIVTGCFWLPVVWMQMRMRDLAEAAASKGLPLPLAYHRLFWAWFAFGFPAFAAVLGIQWLRRISSE
jgi:uncharacterized membrane protein